MGTQPRTQERPKAFHRVDMDFAKAISIVITGKFSLAVIDGMMVIPPLLQSVINVVFIGIDGAAFDNHMLNNGLNGWLLNILQHVNDYLTAPLHETEHRWLFITQRSSSA